jgi:uracil-DNA glycosylase family 4
MDYRRASAPAPAAPPGRYSIGSRFTIVSARSQRIDDDGWDRLHDQVVACRRCPRLRAWCRRVAETKVRRYRDQTYWGRPVPGFGDPRARLLIVGLAPAAHGGNRTGRVFTGDRSGDFLYAALYRAGFANQPHARARGDGLRLRDAYIAALVRCAPPANRPRPIELRRCRPYLEREWRLLSRLRAILALGRIAMDGVLAAGAALGLAAAGRIVFGHGVEQDLDAGLRLFVSYHPSQQNTFTGKLSAAQLDHVLLRIRDYLNGRRSHPRAGAGG